MIFLCFNGRYEINICNKISTPKIAINEINSVGRTCIKSVAYYMRCSRGGWELYDIGSVIKKAN